MLIAQLLCSPKVFFTIEVDAAVVTECNLPKEFEAEENIAKFCNTSFLAAEREEGPRVKSSLML